ncbi:MAG: hypothetical protein WCE63_05875 [Acidobacteriaceae bacterium]
MLLMEEPTEINFKEPTEVTAKRIDRAVARVDFLEKEMLDSDVHFLEVRTSFFDKLAVLAAGSLAVGISFVSAGYQRDSLQHIIQQNLCWLEVAIACILLSLLLSVFHNFYISRAVHSLSSQLGVCRA